MSKYKLDLLNVPNQKFNTTLGDVNITIELRTVRDLCYMSILQDDNYVLKGIKCIPNTGLLNSELRRMINGDILFECGSDEYPNYLNFNNIDCRLVYISK